MKKLSITFSLYKTAVGRFVLISRPLNFVNSETKGEILSIFFPHPRRNFRHFVYAQPRHGNSRAAVLDGPLVAVPPAPKSRCHRLSRALSSHSARHLQLAPA